MIDKIEEKNLKIDAEEINNICEECKEEDESVTQNLILTGFKLCKSCRVSRLYFHFNKFDLLEAYSFYSSQMR